MRRKIAWGRMAVGEGSWVRRMAWSAGTPVRSLLVGAVKAYQMTLSGFLGGRCRFYPSCSEYAAQAVREVGVVRGVALAVWRVLRCSPLSAGGIDHPPQRRGGGPSLYDAAIHPGAASAGARR